MLGQQPFDLGDVTRLDGQREPGDGRVSQVHGPSMTGRSDIQADRREAPGAARLAGGCGRPAGAPRYSSSLASAAGPPGGK
jgi:hypothetical protein